MEEKKKPENPPAFPEPFVNDPHLAISHTKGMTLRDYFAAKAMQAMWSNSTAVGFLADNLNVDNAIKQVAYKAYEIADAMLLERSKNGE